MRLFIYTRISSLFIYLFIYLQTSLRGLDNSQPRPQGAFPSLWGLWHKVLFWLDCASNLSGFQKTATLGQGGFGEFTQQGSKIQLNQLWFRLWVPGSQLHIPTQKFPKYPPTPGQKSHHALMCSRSRCRQAPSSRLFICQKHLLSSAKRETEVATSPEGHSVTYMRKKRGPSIDPCRTPDDTGRGGSLTPRAVTLWTWSVRQSSNQVNRATADAESVELFEQQFRGGSPRDDLRFSNTTGILQKEKTMWFIGVELEQETSAPPPKKHPGSAPAVCCETCRRL